MAKETITFGSELEYQAFVKGYMIAARGSVGNPISIITTDANEKNGWACVIEHAFPINHARIFEPTGKIAAEALAGEQRRGLIK